MIPNTLPPSASTLQRDLDVAIGPRPLLNQTVNWIPGVKYNPPDFMLPWLIWEYGLEQLLPYLSDPRLAIQEGVRWQRIRGTPASLSMALGWLGLADIAIEPEVPGKHFYEYQVDTGQTVPSSRLENVLAVAKFSAPLRSRLSRLYHHYDVRRVILDSSDYGALLSDYSGIRKDGLVLSFGREHHCGTSLGEVAVSLGITASHNTRVPYIHWPTLDNEPLGGVSTQSVRRNDWMVSAELAGQPWLGSWNERRWGELSSPLIAIRNLAVHTRHHDIDFMLSTPAIGMTITYTHTGKFTLNDVAANIAVESIRYLELTDGQPLGSDLPASVRFNARVSGLRLGGQTWLGNWGLQTWQVADYALIGAQNNPLITRYYQDDIQWTDNAIGAALSNMYPGEFNLNNVEIITTRSADHSNLQSADVALHLAASIRMDERSSGIAALGQDWQARWNNRVWNQTDTVLIGTT